MTVTSQGANTVYEFTNGDGTKLLTKTLDNVSSMNIPDNAWAPGEKYIFIEQIDNNVKNDLILTASGKGFPSGDQVLDVGALFKLKNISYSFDGGTGWADPSLLIVETKKPDGTIGPSFWFELPEGSFIQLATHQ